MAVVFGQAGHHQSVVVECILYIDPQGLVESEAGSSIYYDVFVDPVG